MMKTIGITGSSGFIGRHLVQKCLNEGHTVIGVDNFLTSNSEKILKHSKYSFIEMDVRNDKDLLSTFKGCSCIYHLAAAVGVKNINDNPTNGIDINLKGTEAVINIAEKIGCSLFIASSSEVYGKGVRIPFTEGDDLLIGNTSIPRWSYALSKALDEHLALDSFRKKGTKIVVGRFFNTVGSGQTGAYGMVIPRFIDAAIKNENIVVHGDGTQTRCFGNVKEVVDVITSLMDIKTAYGEVINIGSSDEISINDLALKVINKTSSDSKIKYVSYEEAYGEHFEDLSRRVPSVKKLKNILGKGLNSSIDGIIEDILADIN
jgi:UDP-glucose 4-epimerase